MATLRKAKGAASAADRVRRAIEAGGERVWTVQDFDGLPFGAVAQALSRLSRQKILQRVGKGIYYKPRMTAFGASRPNPKLLRGVASRNRTVFPSGLTAANLLGFSTQVPAREELATTGGSLPRSILGRAARIHTRRPEAWRSLNDRDAALLDVIRSRGKVSELPPRETARKILGHLREEGRFERLAEVAKHEPPRVRAILGALGEELGKKRADLAPLRSSLNTLSRFDFGALSTLKTARSWQAKEPKIR